MWRTMAVAQKPPPDWELVYKRNPVERIKRDKAPLAPGRVGFIVATGDAPGLDVRYDNVEVRKL